MSIIFPIITPREGGCMARQIDNKGMQCHRRARYDGLCGYCNMRKIKPPLITDVFIEETFKPKRRMMRVKKTTQFITPNDLFSNKKHSVKSLKLTLKQLGLPTRSNDRKPIFNRSRTNS